MSHVFSIRSKIPTILKSIFFCFPLISVEGDLPPLPPASNANSHTPPLDPSPSSHSTQDSCFFSYLFSSLLLDHSHQHINIV